METEMKKILLPIAILFTLALLLMACSNDNEERKSANENDSEETEEVNNQSNDSDEQNKDDDTPNNHSNNNDEEGKSESASEEPETDDSGKTPSKEEKSEDTHDQSDSEDSEDLSEYSSEEIEYARIWLQLGDTQDIDKLNVKQISAGEPLNPDDKTSVDYPEDVVQLTGSRLAEGSVTYSSNGDGSIKLYKKVPQRWDGENPAGEDTYKEIVEDTEQETINPGDDDKVEELIKILNIDS